jgi:hypothetical protein
MHRQPDLFSPMLARSHHRQGELFDQAAATDADSGLRCARCQSFFVRTTSGYLCCPRGHGKLLAEAVEDHEPAEDTEPAEDCRPWPVQAHALAKRLAKRDQWLWGRWRCICGACRFTRSR